MTCSSCPDSTHTRKHSWPYPTPPCFASHSVPAHLGSRRERSDTELRRVAKQKCAKDVDDAETAVSIRGVHTREALTRACIRLRIAHVDSLLAKALREPPRQSHDFDAAEAGRVSPPPLKDNQDASRHQLQQALRIARRDHQHLEHRVRAQGARSPSRRALDRERSWRRAVCSHAQAAFWIHVGSLVSTRGRQRVLDQLRVHTVSFDDLSPAQP